MGNPKKSRKSKPARQPSPAETCGVYEVECIVAVKAIRGTEGRRFLYNVQWYGYPGENTWEPVENIDAGCDRLLTSFWRNIKAFDKHTTAELKASQEWIDSEIDYFRKTYVPHACGQHNQPAIGYNAETGQIRVYD